MSCTRQHAEPIIPDEVIDRLVFAKPGDTSTDDLTRIVKELERLGAKFRPGFFDREIAAVREDLKQITRLEKVRETYRREQEAEAHRREEHKYDMLFSTTEKGKVRLDYQAIADVLIDQYSPITFQQEIWFYVDGLYRPEQGEILSFVAEVARTAGFEGALTTVVREVRAYVSAHEITADYPFDRYPDALPLANGVLELDWSTDRATLRPYSPEYRFTGKWPAVYDPTADPGPIHDQALSLYVDDEEVMALYQLPAQAILHFCGYGPFKRSYIFEGATNGGKTTYLVDFLNAIFGAENVSNVSLQKIGTDRFAGGDIEKAVINRCDDLSDVPLENVGPFKALTGGFSHNIERKFKTPYRGRITAVHAFSTNMPPTVPDNILFDPAFWSRWIYLRFNNVFEVDPSFVPRTFTAENVSGAFNRILETAFEMRRTGRLIYEQDPGEVRETWQSAANPFEKFVNAEMQTTQTPTLFDKSHLFRAFLAWCGDNEINPRKLPSTIGGFTKMIFSAGFTTTRRGPKNNRDWMYEGRCTWQQSSKYKEMI